MSMDTASETVRWTARKRQVIDLIARGKTNAEIAEALGVSLAGAKWHVSEVLSILGVESREEAAEYWRRERSLSHRIPRALRALAAPLASYKTALGATSMAAIAAGGLVVSGLSADGHGAILAAVETAAPTAAPADFAAMNWVEILSVDVNGRTATLSASTDDPLCTRLTTASSSESSVISCWGAPARFPRGLSMGFGGLSTTANAGRQPSILNGTASADADHVEVDLYGEPTVIVPLVPAPSQLGLDVQFWANVVANHELVARYRTVAADGSVIEEEQLYDPPGTPPRPQVTAPLRELVQLGSNRDDPNKGTIPFPDGGGRAGAIADPAGGVYRFKVEHDGTQPLTLTLWCQTGLQALTWEEGPDSSSNGIVAADIPPDSAGCFFLVNGGDGTHRISAISGP